MGRDGVNLLEMGLRYATTGELTPVAKVMSGGGHVPGGLLQLLVGLPLMVAPHFRSPVVVVQAFHLVAGLVTLLVVRRAAGSVFATVFALCWWLSPWRLYHSGLIWEPAYLYLPAALHLWACWRSRAPDPPLWASALLGLVLAATPQIHASFVVLWALTALLWLRGALRIRWTGMAAGALVGALTLIPTAAAYLEGTAPEVAPSDGFLGRGLLTVHPLLKGILYWFRLGALDVGRNLRDTVFLDAGDPAHARVADVVVAGGWGVQALSVASVALALVATWWYFRPLFRLGWKRWWREGLWTPRGTGAEAGPEPGSDASPNGRGEAASLPAPEPAWLREYAFAAFLAVAVASALSPVTIQRWHLVIAIHAASLPVAAWIVATWQGGRWLQAAILAFLLLRFPIAGLIGAGHPWYEPGWMEEPMQPPERILERIGPVIPERYLPPPGERRLPGRGG